MNPQPHSTPSTAGKQAGGTGNKPDWAKSDRQLGRELRAAAGQTAKARKWPWVLGVLTVASVAGYGYYATQIAVPVETPAVVTPAAPLVMQINPDERAVLVPQTLERRVRATGALAPWQNTQLSAQTGGIVREVAVRPGDSVAAGDLLVQIDSETLSLDLNQARSTESATRAQLALAEQQLDRVRALVDRGITTSASLDEAQNAVTQVRASLESLQDQVASAELRLRNATVLAPFGGIVAARSVEPGQYVGAGTPLIRLVDLSTIELQANAAVADGALLRQGQRVSVMVDGIEDQSFAGIVARTNPVASEGTRTIPVYITIDNADGLLLGGMFATAQVVVNAVADAIALPTVALREDATGPYVLRIEDGHLQRAGVSVGRTWSDGLTHITQGLNPGDHVVTAPLPSLHAGDAVDLVER